MGPFLGASQAFCGVTHWASVFPARGSTATSAMTLSYQRSGSCASFTSRATVPEQRTVPTCTISFLHTALLGFLGLEGAGGTPP